MLIPIGTDVRTHRPPLGNWLLIGLNVLVFAYTDWLGGAAGQQVKAVFALDAVRPALHQYITYQFLHGDLLHIAGNMLFLWIFGNAVCDRMGSVSYVLFYLAGGVFAGYAFTLTGDSPIVGASGAIAAVTTAFLTLYPRVHITLLIWALFIFTIQVPAMILIIFKIILWDNMLAPWLDHSLESNVAHSAHLGGYIFGFTIAIGLLAVRVLPRTQFDLLALWGRWRRRAGLEVGTARTSTRMVGARPVRVEEVGSRPLQSPALSPVEQLRADIMDHLERRDAGLAVEFYRKLLKLDSQQVLSRTHQLEIANLLARMQHYQEAVDAYEAFLGAYPGAVDVPEVRLFMGLLYNRYLNKPERAALQLRRAVAGLKAEDQRRLAEQELNEAMQRLLDQGQPPGDGAS